ncbi:MAG TPA: Holliday junction branch migration protein RuvA [bacterium]|nr:Holliday junction branch migration protein RuvA [bacterium]
MLAYLKGILIEKKTGSLILEVNGVGYHILVPLSTLEKLPSSGEELMIHVQTVRKDDGDLLYGFITHTEKEVFNILTSVTGIGPKTANSLLSSFPPSRLQQAVVEKDTASLSKVPGVGRKTAERIVLELKDKMKEVETGESVPYDERFKIALEGLISLGYKVWEARQALNEAKPGQEKDYSAEDLLKAALRYL